MIMAESFHSYVDILKSSSLFYLFIFAVHSTNAREAQSGPPDDSSVCTCCVLYLSEAWWLVINVL